MLAKLLTTLFLLFAAIGVYSLIDGWSALAHAEAGSLGSLAIVLCLVIAYAVAMYFVEGRQNPSTNRRKAWLLLRIDNWLRVMGAVGAIAFVGGLIIVANFDFDNQTLGWILPGSFIGLATATVGALGHGFMGAYLSPTFKEIYETDIAAEFESNFFDYE